MRRVIVGWHRDDLGDWVAELSCRHGQHVRHRPPFREAPWVETEAGRAERIGADWDCPLCDPVVGADEGGDPACWAHLFDDDLR